MVGEGNEDSFAREDGAPLMQRTVDRVKRADDQVVSFVKERPLVALGVALAVGYVFGRIVTRS